MKEIPKDKVPEIAGGVLPTDPGGGLTIPGMPDPMPGYPQIPTVPCFPDPIIGRSKS